MPPQVSELPRIDRTKNDQPKTLNFKPIFIPMKPILFSLFLFPLFLAAQGSWSDPIYTYDATGNRISRHRDPLRRANPHPVAPAWQLTLSPLTIPPRAILGHYRPA